MKWHSQIGQDKWAFTTLGEKREGFFVDLGAADGLEFSNTLALEEEFGWTGICIEPDDAQFATLRKRRKCTCVHALVLDGVHEVQYKCAGIFGGMPEYLFHESALTPNVPIVTKTTRTLGDILDECKAPPVIDFLSLDTEGTEPRILSVFPFDKYCFRTICVEHNDMEGAKKYLRELLRSKDYQLVGGANFGDGRFMPEGGGQDDFWIGPCL